MADWEQKLRENVATVRRRMAEACGRAGRDPADVCLVGVTKYVSTEVAEALVAAGVPDIGESRVQQLTARATELGAARLDWPEPGTSAADRPRWHMIGHLQRNKVNAFLTHARILHSLDSVRLAETLERHAAELDVAVDVFIELNVAGEVSKQGADPAKLDGLVETVGRCSHIRLRGLMAMAPYDEDPEASRPHFARLRGLLQHLRDRGRVDEACRHLSMGMSEDYVVAVEEGATFVRVGSALFEGLPTRDPRDA